MAKHGIFITEAETELRSTVTAESGIALVIGAAPVQSAKDPAPVGAPVLVTGFDEFREKFGYSDDWATYPLCEAAWSQFLIYGIQPVIFVNLLDPASAKTAVAAADLTVAEHRVELPFEALDTAALTVKQQGGSGDAYVKGTDYEVFYEGGALVIELLAAGACYSAAKLNIAYDKATPASVDAAAAAIGMEAVESCASVLGIVPDLLLAPGLSEDASLAAVMAAKAAGINGMFRALALCDLDASTNTTPSAAIAAKNAGVWTEYQLACWPQVKLGGKQLHMSTVYAGLMAQVDAQNGGVPVESPSNKALQITGICAADGSEIGYTLAQAEQLNDAGISIANRFLGGWSAWCKYTALYPAGSDPKSIQLPVRRMFSWVNNTIIRNFWTRLDSPMTRTFVDVLVDETNIWINGLTASGNLLGGRVVYLANENPPADLAAGIVRLHIYLTPPSAAQEIDVTLEYDANYLSAAFAQ